MPAARYRYSALSMQLYSTFSRYFLDYFMGAFLLLVDLLTIFILIMFNLINFLLFSKYSRFIATSQTCFFMELQAFDVKSQYHTALHLQKPVFVSF